MDNSTAPASLDENPLVDAEAGSTEERLSLLETQLVELKNDGGENGGGAISAAIARLSQAPTAWHQATVYFLGEGEEHGVRMLAVGSVVVMLQTFAAFGIMLSTFEQSCTNSEVCEIPGTWCNPGNGRCIYCGDDLPLPLEGGTWVNGQVVLDPDNVDGVTFNHPDATLTPGVVFGGYNTTTVVEVCTHTWAGTAGFGRVGIAGVAQETFYGPQDVHAWCNECVEPLTHDIRPVTFISNSVGNARSMGPFDWCSMALSGYIVALAVVGELKDIRLMEIAMDRAGDAIAPSWQWAVAVLNFIRRWIFLAVFGWIIPNLVLKRGGNSLNICFNTIAVTFLAEVDQVVYNLALNEPMREAVEARMRMPLSEEHTQSIVGIRTAHVPTMMFFILTSLLLARVGSCDGAACDSNANMWGSLASLMFPLEPLCAAMFEHLLVGNIVSRAGALSFVKGIAGFVLVYAIIFSQS